MTVQYPFLSKAFIENVAEKLRTSSKYYVNNHCGAVTPIEQITEQDHGINIDFDNLQESLELKDFGFGNEQILGAMIFSKKQILVDENLDPDENPRIEGRFRFTIAHELGHWILHRHLFENEINPVATLQEANENLLLRQKTPNARLEWQANYFASCILMPRIEVERAWYQFAKCLQPFRYTACRPYLNLPYLKSTWRKIGDSIPFDGYKPASRDSALDRQRIFHLISIELATLLNVSTQSMQIRLNELGWIA